jgi:hypothetical protein
MKNFSKTVFLGVFLFCSTGFAQESDSVTKIRTLAVQAIEKVEKIIFGGDVKPNPQPQPACPCNGTGFITHGDGHKTPCPCPAGQCNCAKKKADTPKAVSPNFVMYTKSWCGPCQSWKRESSQRVKDAGWVYQEVEDDSIIRSAGVTNFPTFDITIKGKTYRHVGKLSMQKFQEIVRNAN